ncbi:protein PHOSPHATE-INDUCED 1-like [Nymphaea colorata]|uniref:Phosphate-induced protein 1 n=1 Tax=Nymphaea colorata TaxID=210225 RepID=A0A5K0X2T9_9MAGN|nr:protein PHOSPHATE-INDUCED 1-like [Nymphaea colorata]
MVGIVHLEKFVLLLSLVHACLGVGGRKLTALVQQPPLVLTYHKGALLQGSHPFSIVWYGEFTPSQRSIVSDFLSSFNHQEKSPSVSSWWKVIEAYLVKAGMQGSAMVVLGKQVLDDKYSLGKSLKRAQIGELAAKATTANGITLVLTSKDVAVEGFCMSSCGFHDSSPLQPSGEKFAYIWVGNSESQCPGQCAWPFHQPLYGPQTRPLVPPNGDVGVDGMIINIASMLAGTVTNPYKSGYFQGPATAPLEAASACSGIYGKNAYPGYAGELLVDSVSGASYNANGINGRRYLLPALWNPDTSTCYTLV